ncbi:MAG: hypothetical protein BAJALOKI2v1_780017 [Promethearchaeota archaeon]|nr:MAG: hypothetical protein BAJALOKI2v1_780017 [Candidatus Lokiarchaeota archaeon]
MHKGYCEENNCFSWTNDEKIKKCIERSKFVKNVRKKLMEKRLKDKIKLELLTS